MVSILRRLWVWGLGARVFLTRHQNVMMVKLSGVLGLVRILVHSVLEALR